jgi:acetyl-CoA acyltransferase
MEDPPVRAGTITAKESEEIRKMSDVREVVIVAYGRSAIGKAIKGTLKDTHPVTLGGQVLAGVLKRVPQLKAEDIEDLAVGCSQPDRKQGCNMGRLVAARAGLPYSVPAQTINRFCSSGLQSIASAANSIAVGQHDIVVAGGVEIMAKTSTQFEAEYHDPWIDENEPNFFLPMGFTAENVAKKYGISRLRMDEFSCESNRRAAEARESGKFKEEIIPVEAVMEDGSTTIFDQDQCIRPGTTVEVLGNLKPSFLEGGCVTAGNSSQMSDGASFVVMMTREKANELGLKPIARFLGFAVGGVDPAYMGIGPVVAIPKILAKTGLTLDQIDVIELNEAFASQAIYCIDTLKMDPAKVNPNGGAIAMGHPLGATGSILTCKTLSELKRTGGKYGMVSMCVGGGMGAAGIYEML